MTARAAMAASFAASIPAIAYCVTASRGRPPQSVTPDIDRTYTSTRQVTCLAVSPEGDVWAGTTGGILRWLPGGKWQKVGKMEGPPSSEVKQISFDSGTVLVEFPTQSAIWSNGRWLTGAVPLRSPANPIRFAETRAEWRGRTCSASLAGVRIEKGKASTVFPLPPSIGTHVGGMASYGDLLLAGMYGDGLWEYNGKDWKKSEMSVPPEAREITALATNGQSLWIGTRRAGIWEFDGKNWTQQLRADEPFDHNAQALVMFHGDLYMSTLEDGLCVKTPQGWVHFTSPTLSSNAPRQMAEFQDKLFVRHGNGSVDVYDGNRWEKNVCASLPRKEVSAIAAEGGRLYAAVWGGWSEFDGSTWSSHFPKELAGMATTAILADKGQLWIGTQGHGVAQVDLQTWAVNYHDERKGMPDDWVTCLCRSGNTIYAGTFVGGMAWFDGGRWKAAPELIGENVTGLEPDGHGGLFVAARKGIWRCGPEFRMSKMNDRLSWLDEEAQCLCRTGDGLWAGARTGLFYISPRSVSAK